MTLVKAMSASIFSFLTLLAFVIYIFIKAAIGVALLILLSQHLKNFNTLVAVLKLPSLALRRLLILTLIGIEFTIPLLLLNNIFKQIAASLLILYSSMMLILLKRLSHSSIPSKNVYIFMLVFGLLMLAANAFDLPV